MGVDGVTYVIVVGFKMKIIAVLLLTSFFSYNDALFRGLGDVIEDKAEDFGGKIEYKASILSGKIESKGEGIRDKLAKKDDFIGRKYRKKRSSNSNPSQSFSSYVSQGYSSRPSTTSSRSCHEVPSNLEDCLYIGVVLPLMSDICVEQ